MKNIFNIFRRKRHITYDCETLGIIPLKDAAKILQNAKEDFDTVTRILNAMPINAMDETEPNPAVRKQRMELWEWNNIARTNHYNLGIDIENLERIMHERIPGLKDAEESLDGKGGFATD